MFSSKHEEISKSVGVNRLVLFYVFKAEDQRANVREEPFIKHQSCSTILLEYQRVGIVERSERSTLRNQLRILGNNTRVGNRVTLICPSVFMHLAHTSNRMTVKKEDWTKSQKALSVLK